MALNKSEIFRYTNPNTQGRPIRSPDGSRVVLASGPITGPPGNSYT